MIIVITLITIMITFAVLRAPGRGGWPALQPALQTGQPSAPARAAWRRPWKITAAWRICSVPRPLDGAPVGLALDAAGRR